MKNGIDIKIVSLIGFVFSILSTIEGISVILGASIPGYVVVPALLYYNIFFGIAGLVVSIALWFRAKWSLRSAATIALFHSTVLILVAVFHFVDGTFAIDSVRAMSIRSILWLIISLFAWKTNTSNTKKDIL